MITWIFAGMCDKSELLFYLCKMLSSSSARVLLIDATDRRKYPYYIGHLDQQLLITEFSGFDVACGFDDEVHLEAHLANSGSSLAKYDYVIYDLELPEFCSSKTWEGASARVWVTDYEIWTLEEGRRWLREAVGRYRINGFELEMYKVIVRAVDEWFDEAYLEGYFSHMPIRWKGDPVYIPWNEADCSLRLRNEHFRCVQMKPLTRGYKRKVCLLMQMLTDWDQKQINRVLRAAERRRA